MKLTPRDAVMWMMIAVVGCQILCIILGVCTCIWLGATGHDTTDCKGAFREPLANLLAFIMALWAGTHRYRPPTSKP